MNVTIKQYIPAGSEVVTYSNGEHKWYTTKTNVPVIDPKPEVCPVREIEAVTIQYKGYAIWFLETQVNVELSDEQTNQARHLDLVFLQYDIPTAVTRRGELEHPSSYLWARGVRTSLSCWVLPKGNVPMLRLRELTRAGCTWHVTKVDASEAPNLLQRSIAALQTERLEAIRRFEESTVAADARFNDGEGDVNAKIKRRAADTARIQKAYDKAMENVKQGSEALNIPFAWVEGVSLRTQIRMVNAAAKSKWETKALVTEDAVTRLRNIGTTEATAMADSLANEKVDPRIVADYLEEHDSDVFSLRDVYGDD